MGRTAVQTLLTQACLALSHGLISELLLLILNLLDKEKAFCRHAGRAVSSFKRS